MLVTDLKTCPGGADPQRGGELVQGQAVIATDYLKSFLATLRNIFGGEVKSYESLLQRARREAILRMMAEARRRGYNAVCNIRLTMSENGLLTSLQDSSDGNGAVKCFFSSSSGVLAEYGVLPDMSSKITQPKP